MISFVFKKECIILGVNTKERVGRDQKQGGLDQVGDIVVGGRQKFLGILLCVQFKFQSWGIQVSYIYIMCNSIVIFI